jgi:hypothetical protein
MMPKRTVVKTKDLPNTNLHVDGPDDEWADDIVEVEGVAPQESTPEQPPIDASLNTEERPFDPSPSLSEPIDLDMAANLILQMIPPNFKLLAEEVADVVLKVPRWHLVAGLVLAMIEQGMVAIPSIDPGWGRESFNAKEVECEQCHAIFVPDHIGQRFCSNFCGNRWAQDHKVRVA